MTKLAVVNFVYTFVVMPYAENNIGEILNEAAVLLCAYMMNVFLQCNVSETSRKLGWVFRVCMAAERGKERKQERAHMELVVVHKHFVLGS